MLMYRHLHFLRSLGEARAWYLLRLKKTILGTGGVIRFLRSPVSVFPGEKQERAWAALTPRTPGIVSEPESPHIWLQLALVCFQFCTQTTTLAVNSGMAQPSVCTARGGGDSASSPGPGWGPLPFQLAFVSVSVSPLERGFCGKKHTFIIISPLLTPSPSAINYVPAKKGLCSVARPANTYPYRTETSGRDTSNNNLLGTDFVALCDSSDGFSSKKLSSL